MGEFSPPHGQWLGQRKFIAPVASVRFQIAIVLNLDRWLNNKDQ